MDLITRVELGLIKDFLEECADEFADHSCNDFTLPANEGNKALFLEVLRQHDPEESGLTEDEILSAQDQVRIFDDWLLGHCAQRCAAVLGPAGGPGLSAVELGAIGEVLRHACAWREEQSADVSFDEIFAATAENKAIISAALREMSPVIDAYEDRAMRKAAAKQAAAAAKIILKSKSEDDEIEIPGFWLMMHFSSKCIRLARQLAASGTQFTVPEPAPAAGGRRGVDPKWIGRWKTSSKKMMSWLAECEPEILQNLDEIARTGRIDSKYNTDHRPIHPPKKDWERIPVFITFSFQSRFHLARMDAQVIKDGKVDWRLGLHAFAAAYTEAMIVTEIQNRLTERYGVSPSERYISFMPFVALGVVLGCDEAFRLARMIAVSCRKGYVDEQDSYPIFAFMLRILADYLDGPPVMPPGAEKLPEFTELYALWRSTDLDRFADACLAACDCHTWRTAYSVKENREYFDTWVNTPIEILLLFRLRSLLGLANPVLDHPLMQSPLARPPEEPMPFTGDALVAAARARMMRDGYDEDAIYKETVQ